MKTTTKMFATLGVGAVIAAGVMAAGSTPAKADGLRISDYNGRVGFSLSLGTPQYCAPVYAAPSYYEAPSYYQAPVYVAPSWGDRDDRGRFDRDRDERGDRGGSNSWNGRNGRGGDHGRR